MIASFRRKARLWFDRLFWKNLADVTLLGEDSDWWVCTRLLAPGSMVLSGGAGKDVSFECALVHRGCKVVVFDPSPTGKATMEKKVNQLHGLQFFPQGLAAREAAVKFALPAIPEEGSFRLAAENTDSEEVEFRCVPPQKALELAGFADCSLCKLDIEGFEYEVLAALLRAGLRPAQIAVEFHHFMPGIKWRQTVDSIRELQRAGYRIVRKRQTDYLFVRKEFIR